MILVIVFLATLLMPDDFGFGHMEHMLQLKSYKWPFLMMIEEKLWKQKDRGHSIDYTDDSNWWW